MHDNLRNSSDKNEKHCQNYKGQISDAIGMRASHRRSPGICLSIVGEPGTRLRQFSADHERGLRRAQARTAQPLDRSIYSRSANASVVIAVHVLVPFIAQMFRPFVDMTLRATRGAFPIVVRIVQIIVRVGVLPPCKPRRWVDEIPVNGA